MLRVEQQTTQTITARQSRAWPGLHATQSSVVHYSDPLNHRTRVIKPPGKWPWPLKRTSESHEDCTMPSNFP
ncbi:hypothetical protein LZ30DRAFT_718129 [Colletotrichum cereale]|nr:hypothetical protein LZ30DRAFT_718129 [Colletotrichum cereale]